MISTSISEKPVLVIPVYNGGGFFRECFSSVVGKEFHFERVLISLNGTPDGRAEDRATLESFGKLAENVVLLETPCSMESFEHHKFIMEALSNEFSDDRLVMNLFHDDVLLRAPKLGECEKESVMLGDWGNLLEGGSIAALKKSSLSPTNWIHSFSFHRIPSNGSGMVAPLGVLRDVSLSLQKWRTGVRFEYLLCTHSSVKSLCAAKEPMVALRIHAGQEGANVNRSSYVRGEVLFMIWLTKHGRAKGVSGLAVLVFLGMALVKNATVRMIGNYSKKRR